LLASKLSCILICPDFVELQGKIRYSKLGKNIK
jgi:hypothetical protein